MEGCQMSCSFYGCKRTYNTSEALNNHLQDHHKNTAQSLPGKVFLCSQIGCDGSFNNMQQLMDHMRHHYKPNCFFLCESCKAKLRSYRTLLKHLQTCAKVAKNKATKIEPGTAPDAEPTGLSSSDMEPSGSFLATNAMEDRESTPTNTQTNMPVTQQSLDNKPHKNPHIGPASLLLSVLSAASTQNPHSQQEVPYNSFPPTLSPVNPAYNLQDPGHQQQRSPRSGPPSLPSSPLLPSSPGSNAVWRKNQDPSGPLLHRWNSPSSQSLNSPGQSINCRILWEHTRGRYTCLQCGYCAQDRAEMTAHIEGQHKNPGGKVNNDPDTEVGNPSLLAKTTTHSLNSTYTQL